MVKNMAKNNGKEAVKTQHSKGKLTAKERIDLLLDKGTFTELDELVELDSVNYGLQEKKQPGDGVITGYGKINGKPACIFAQDFTFMGGSMGEMHNIKIAKIQEHALKIGCPIIGLFDSGGARIQEGIHALDTGGRIFKNNTFAFSEEIINLFLKGSVITSWINFFPFQKFVVIYFL